MKKGICYVCIPDGAGVEERLATARAAGFDGVELTFHEPGEGPLTLESSRGEVQALLDTVRRAGLEVPSVMCGAAVRHTPVLHPEASVRGQAVRNLALALERARWLGATAVLLHPGQLRPETPYDAAYEWTLQALRALRPHCEEHGVAIALENVWNKFLLSPMEFRTILDEVNHSLVGAYFDVGNVLLFGYSEHWVRILGRRIKKVHVKDFKRAIGTIQGFCQLLEGDANYPAVMRELRAIGYDDYLTSEVSQRDLPPGQTMADVARRIDQIMQM